MPYIRSDVVAWGVLSLAGHQLRAPEVQRTTPMTIEILYLTHQLQRWINRRVARHLAAQAARLSR
jgi:hypothetical protein